MVSGAYGRSHLFQEFRSFLSRLRIGLEIITIAGLEFLYFVCMYICALDLDVDFQKHHFITLSPLPSGHGTNLPVLSFSDDTKKPLLEARFYRVMLRII